MSWKRKIKSDVVGGKSGKSENFSSRLKSSSYNFWCSTYRRIATDIFHTYTVVILLSFLPCILQLTFANIVIRLHSSDKLAGLRRTWIMAP